MDAIAENAGDRVGGNVRLRRKRRGWTLQQLADRSGISRAMISDVERGRRNPSVRVAYQLAVTLGCTISDLLDEETVAGPSVLGPEQRLSLVDREGGVERYLQSPELARRGIEVLWYRIGASAVFGPMPANRPGVVEHITVLEGELICQLGGREHRLGPQAAITYDACETTYRNPTENDCCFVLVIDSTRSGGPGGLAR